MANDETNSDRSRTGAGNIPMGISLAEASTTFPGFRFSPTDEELIQYYLRRKLQGFDEGLEVIPVVDICRHEPWDLPAQSVIHSDNEWFFFSPRGRKYPNGTQSKRATVSGYWKATGKERDVKSGPTLIGTKRTLVFHTGRAPKGQRTGWIMHEYTTSNKSQDAMVVCRVRKNKENFQLNDDPRRDERGLLAVDNSTSAISGCSSSQNSHSGGSHCDEKVTNESKHENRTKSYGKGHFGGAIDSSPKQSPYDKFCDKRVKVPIAFIVVVVVVLMFLLLLLLRGVYKRESYGRN